ncbi:D-alanyl-D-alanine carboxypeptidase [Actinomadura meyerae]|uniref:D-alanyl-D-alanine carboxypeptidase n=1 Tax=Actinomadura meyerae TaxID=240840 RepID=A0A239P5D7_9ACTN|nr:D-alanyl-D-alanine carboxypeptidase [Actinomadura meyerae]SNT62286.1 D-alanyl-D-alanine carboxypeptidase [Actinomadura meyerae]
MRRSPHGGAGLRERPGAPGQSPQWAREASVTRAERLPVQEVRESGEYPSSRSSGQWSVPWDGSPPRAPQAPAAQEAPEEKRRGRRWLIVLVAAVVLVAGVVTGQLIRPVPEPAIDLAIASSHAFPGQAPTLPWPSAGQSAIYVDGLGSMGVSGGSAPTPTASVAKVMTAYVYLRDHPLKPGEPGPVLTVSPEAAAQIPMRRKREESLLGVTAYQKLTQRKALEALLIISANDVAHELARWDSGDEQAFVAKMNAAAAQLGMTATHYTDPSGYDSGTVSTAADQVKLLKAAMDLPEFATIVNNRAYVPDGAGQTREGGNFLLGQYGVVGGKTGYTDAAGGNFVFAARKTVQGVETLIVGAVMGQRSPSAAGAVNAAARLVAAAESALTAVTLAQRGARVALVDDGLGGTTPLRAAAPVTVVGWPGLTVHLGVEGEPPHRAAAGEQAGTLTTGAGAVPLRLGRTLDEPSYLKRLIRLK